MKAWDKVIITWDSNSHDLDKWSIVILEEHPIKIKDDCNWQWFYNRTNSYIIRSNDFKVMYKIWDIVKYPKWKAHYKILKVFDTPKQNTNWQSSYYTWEIIWWSCDTWARYDLLDRVELISEDIEEPILNCSPWRLIWFQSKQHCINVLEYIEEHTSYKCTNHRSFTDYNISLYLSNNTNNCEWNKDLTWFWEIRDISKILLPKIETMNPYKIWDSVLYKYAWYNVERTDKEAVKLEWIIMLIHMGELKSQEEVMKECKPLTTNNKQMKTLNDYEVEDFMAKKANRTTIAKTNKWLQDFVDRLDSANESINRLKGIIQTDKSNLSNAVSNSDIDSIEQAIESFKETKKFADKFLEGEVNGLVKISTVKTKSVEERFNSN